jgi:N-alpha-acetyl-L-2,4-diaminobutyrate deacetylase
MSQTHNPATAASPIHATVDFNRPGKQHGHLMVPYSYNLGGWANLLIPITVIQNGSGPTALVSGGNHGDEYPGQIAVMKLCRELQPGQITGRLILVPSLNFPAAKAATRLSPLDGMNLNRAFPGRPDGSVTSQIAHYLTTVLFPLSDIVIDIHTGGRSMDFVPCATMHLVSDLVQRKSMIDGVEAWNTDISFVYADVAGSGLLPVEAENQGKIVVTTEMGGGEPVSRTVHAITQDGLANVLRQQGVLQGPVLTRRGLGLPPTRWVQALSRDDYRFAPESGIFEPLLPLGAEAAPGQTVAQIHFLERPDREPVPIIAPTGGLLLATRGPAMVAQGDCVACIAHDVDIRGLK